MHRQKYFTVINLLSHVRVLHNRPSKSCSLVEFAVLLFENLKVPDAATEVHGGTLTKRMSDVFAGMELGMQGAVTATTMAMPIPPIIMGMTMAMSQLVTTTATTMAMDQDSHHHPLCMLAMATTMVRVCPVSPHLRPLQDMPYFLDLSQMIRHALTLQYFKIPASIAGAFNTGNFNGRNDGNNNNSDGNGNSNGNRNTGSLNGSDNGNLNNQPGGVVPSPDTSSPPSAAKASARAAESAANAAPAAALSSTPVPAATSAGSTWTISGGACIFRPTQWADIEK